MTQAKSRNWLPVERRDFLRGIAFISPWLVGFLVFTVFPILASLYYSFTDYSLLNSPEFVGLKNYITLFTRDEFFGKVVYNTLYLAVLAVPSSQIVAFLLASLLNTKLVGRSIFRTIFFIPSIVPVVSSAMIWLWIYNTQYGLINSNLVNLGLPVIPFLSSPKLAKISLIIIYCWATGSSMMIFLAALQDVPQSLYDAAKVDGAGAVARFFNVTIPMCTPAILFNLLMGVIDTFQYFTFVWVLTRGGPNFSTEFYSVYLYRNAFAFLKMGYASAMAWILFLIVLVVTFVLFRTSARWVYYGGAVE
jgi:multiple sugar transport system permease protein